MSGLQLRTITVCATALVLVLALTAEAGDATGVESFQNAIKPVSVASIGEVGRLNSGTQVWLTGTMTVTAAWPDFYYIVENCVFGAVKVIEPAHGFTAGQHLTELKGVIHLDADTGEICIVVTAKPVVTGYLDVRPLLCNQRAIGIGGLFGTQSTWNWKWVKQPDKTIKLEFHADRGLGTIGLFVRITGKITYKDSSKPYFYVDDGSRLMDGTLPDGNAYVKGLRIESDTACGVGQMVIIDGIASLFKVEDGTLRIRLRPSSITPVP